MSTPSSTTWPNGIPADQYTLEHASHIFYRDTLLLLNPRTPLPADLATRLRALDCQLQRRPASREFVQGVRSSTDLEIPGKPFYNKYMRNMVHVMNLVCRLENLRDVEQDLKTRLQGRLGQVRLLQRRDEMGVWMWVLELEDEVQEGLREVGGRRKGGKGRARGGGDDSGDPMEIDG